MSIGTAVSQLEFNIKEYPTDDFSDYVLLRCLLPINKAVEGLAAAFVGNVVKEIVVKVEEVITFKR